MIATLGEALVDLIQQEDGSFQARLGGSICNFSVGIARQNLEITYLNPLSNDIFGTQFRSYLLDNAVRISANTPSLLPTSLAIVQVDAAEIPSYAFYRDAIADRDTTALSIIADIPQNATIFHTGGLALAPDDIEKTLTVLEYVRDRSMLLSIDANVRPFAFHDHAKYIAGIWKILQRAHVLKVSDEDAAYLGITTSSLSAIAEEIFAKTSVQLLAITHGPEGAALFTRTKNVQHRAYTPQIIIDTVGAGDCFYSGLIGYLYHANGLDSLKMLTELSERILKDALQHALISASINLGRSGCDPASWQAIRAIAQPKG